MPKVNAEAAIEARRLYEEGAGVNAISRATGLHRATIRKLRDVEGWVPGETAQDRGQVADAVRSAIRADVIDLGRKRGIAQVIESGVAHDTADLVATVLREQGRLILSVTRSSQSAFDLYEAGTLSPAQAMMLRCLVASATQSLDAGRTFAGLKDGQASVPQSADASAPIIIEHHRLETVELPVDERGRHLAGWRRVEDSEELNQEAS
jgi:hypothetical protein